MDYQLRRKPKVGQSPGEAGSRRGADPHSRKGDEHVHRQPALERIPISMRWKMSAKKREGNLRNNTLPSLFPTPELMLLAHPFQ
jgi:hypothetical protein